MNAVEVAQGRGQDWNNATKIVAGDFNGVGRDDVVTTGDGALLRYGNGGLSDGVSMCPEKSWKGVQAILGGDFDGNGKPDLGSLWNNQQK
ncbi:FG-GAP repeat domain-containing protein [Streptomyces sp. NPDC006692]|uniref:FG-GAP repeat domain-containing protein n=1 Tax=Streptomyces sp. NPDC006692 TaxID=3364758 RepID=UPI0036C2D614